MDLQLFQSRIFHTASYFHHEQHREKGVDDVKGRSRARVADDDKQVPTGRHLGAVLVTQRDAIPEDVQLLVRGQDEVWVLQLVVDELRELEALGALERTQRSRSRAC